MYKFLGKKGQLYKFDPDEVIMKLNYKCPKNPDGTFNCDLNKTEKSDKGLKNTSSNNRKDLVTKEKELLNKYMDAHKAAKFKMTPEVKAIQKELQAVRGQIDGKITGGTSQEIKQVLTKTKSVIEKVKKEKASGKVSKESIKELKNSINDTKKLLEKPVSSVTDSYKSLVYKDLVTNTTKLISSNEKYKNAMMDYTTDSSLINQKLIAHSALSSSIKEKIATLDNLMENSAIPNDMVVHSGISKELYDKLAKSTNKPFKTNAFISTSANKKVAEGFAQYRNKSKEPGYMLEIRMPKDSHAIATTGFVEQNFKDTEYVVGEDGKFLSGGSQHEVILPRNSIFKIIETVDEVVPNKNYPTKNYIIKKIIVEIGA